MRAILRALRAGTFDRLYTWHLETIVVATFLAAIVIWSPHIESWLDPYWHRFLDGQRLHRPSEWVGFFALLMAHGRNSVMFRLVEAQRHGQARRSDEAESVLSDLRKYCREDVIVRVRAVTAAEDPAAARHRVHCWRWADAYFYAGECLWAYYFLDHRAWAALAGVAVFVGYARWRGWYARRRAV